MKAIVLDLFDQAEIREGLSVVGDSLCILRLMLAMCNMKFVSYAVPPIMMDSFNEMNILLDEKTKIDPKGYKECDLKIAYQTFLRWEEGLLQMLESETPNGFRIYRKKF